MSAVATQEPQADTTEVVRPGKQEAPRYAEGTAELSALILATREKVGRAKLADWLGISMSACWRAERDKIHPEEVAHLRERMAQVDQLPVPEPKSKASKLDRVREVLAQADSLTKKDLVARLTEVVG